MPREVYQSLELKDGARLIGQPFQIKFEFDVVDKLDVAHK